MRKVLKLFHGPAPSHAGTHGKREPNKRQSKEKMVRVSSTFRFYPRSIKAI